jgi:two-component system, chemotaxis family, chemotaxis protein CheY
MKNPLEQFSVIIIDDDRLIQRLVFDILHTLGFGHVYRADDGKHALELLKTITVDFIICDWRMPNLNGIDLIKLIRKAATPVNPLIPILMLTGNAEAHHVVTARDAGANEYLVKPFNIKQLCARIMEIVEKPREFVLAPAFKGPSRRRKAMHPRSLERRKRTPKPIKVNYAKR